MSHFPLAFNVQGRANYWQTSKKQSSKSTRCWMCPCARECSRFSQGSLPSDKVLGDALKNLTLSNPTGSKETIQQFFQSESAFV
ncbi:hypothetical protein PAXRUDRAFT_824918 [Paxillus rubicundulus Ve08.2h10]|uniref:Uncharacterized protein n=1 Tax=Paxillus rubicundulus Ve08.2h10 TaxID=930991 RepID=A0A0D0DH76_9AGAM|nr:hypothetical protein PAXRUDRAFT_824918 [Paxillus rubicundulus Ve08.2h10]